MTALELTPSQTVGPYLAIGLLWPDGSDVVARGTPGAIRISGLLFDGEGSVVPDGLIETWQADPDGRFDHPDDPRGAVRREGFRGFGRCPTAPDGSWTIRTLKPGPVPASDGSVLAPHLDVSVFARGMLDRLVTRIYFGDETELNAADPVLGSVPAERRDTLIAQPDFGGDTGGSAPLDFGGNTGGSAPLDFGGDTGGSAPLDFGGNTGGSAPRAYGYRLDLRLQGENETVFFAV